MAQHVEMLAAKPDNLSSIPRTHMVEEKLFSDLCMHTFHVCK